MSSGLGNRVGALLSVVTSGASLEDAFAGLAVLYEGSLALAFDTLRTLLQVENVIVIILLQG